MHIQTVRLIAQAEELAHRLYEMSQASMWNDYTRHRRLYSDYLRAAKRFYRRGGRFYTEGTWTERLRAMEQA
jgi:hypothetical protein